MPPVADEYRLSFVFVHKSAAKTEAVMEGVGLTVMAGVVAETTQLFASVTVSVYAAVVAVVTALVETVAVL